MLRLALPVLVLLGVLASVARAQPAAPPGPLPSAAHHYALEAALDEATRQVRGTARIRFRNTSAQPLGELVLHLYLNAFRDAKSVFMRESGGALRGERFRGAGALSLETLRVDDEDVLNRSERELIAGDFTQLRVPLARPLAPGAEVRLESRFVAQLPPLFARSGYTPDAFYVVAQWFPKLAKLEADGRFASFPYHAHGEFYADFADYTLALDVPADMAVVARGLRGDGVTNGARRVHRFEAQHVHDLAFVAARGYREDVESVDGILVRYLSPAGYGWALPTHAHVVRSGLRAFGSAFGAYPYPSLSVVLPPSSASGGAGMEYPSLIVSESTWWSGARLPSLAGPFVTAHELAHQWFYGILASDELHHPVLDEGLAQWASLDLMRQLFGAREGLEPVLALERFEVTRIFATRFARSVAPGLAAPAYTPGEYAASVYARAALALESIRRAHGRERFERALALYTSRHRFGHPGPGALEAAFDAAYGQGFAARVLRPLLFEGAGSSVYIAEARTQPRADGYATRIRARRGVGVALPTWLALYDRAGRELTRVRFPSDTDALLTTLETRAPVARVVLDPDRALLLDERVADQIVSFDDRAHAPLLAQIVALAQLATAGLGP